MYSVLAPHAVRCMLHMLDAGDTFSARRGCERREAEQFGRFQEVSMLRLIHGKLRGTGTGTQSLAITYVFWGHSCHCFVCMCHVDHVFSSAPDWMGAMLLSITILIDFLAFVVSNWGCQSLFCCLQFWSFRISSTFYSNNVFLCCLFIVWILIYLCYEKPKI
jgi:hypothetical protein